MKISTRTRYGIRAMIEIALNQDQGPVDLQLISEHQDISRKYLHALLVCPEKSRAADQCTRAAWRIYTGQAGE